MAIFIRAVDVSDADAIAQLYRLPKVRQGTLRMPYESAAVYRDRIEKASPTTYQLAAIDSKNQKLVGNLVLIQFQRSRQHVGTVVVAVHDDYHGQGIGTQLMEEAIEIADNWVNLRRLELEAFVDNPAAIHLYEKFGFRKEGTLKMYAFRGGRYVDAYTMARFHEPGH